MYIQMFVCLSIRHFTTFHCRFLSLMVIFSYVKKNNKNTFSLPHNGKNNKAIKWSFLQRKVPWHTCTYTCIQTYLFKFMNVHMYCMYIIACWFAMKLLVIASEMKMSLKSLGRTRPIINAQRPTKKAELGFLMTS